jgi:hypothetical protein
MNPLLDVPHVELRVPYAKIEQEFLQLAVQAAARKNRQLHHQVGASRAPAAQGGVPPWNAVNISSASQNLSLPD